MRGRGIGDVGLPYFIDDDYRAAESDEVDMQKGNAEEVISRKSMWWKLECGEDSQSGVM